MSVATELTLNLEQDADSVVLVLPGDVARQIAAYVDELMAEESEVSGYERVQSVTDKKTGITATLRCEGDKKSGSCWVTMGHP
jgi:hypothetical protein